jgi:Plant transposon protein
MDAADAGDESQSNNLFEAERDEEDKLFTAAVWQQMVALVIAELDQEKVHGGSTRGKAPNVDRPFAETHTRFLLKYFWPVDQIRPDSNNEYGPRAPEKAFERRFRMPRVVFNRVFENVVRQSEYFRKGLNPNAVGQTGISPLLKVIVAIRTLAYALPSDIADDMFEVSETTASMCLHEFARAVVECFEAEYLREPTEEDLIQIEKQFREAGWPGCIGVVDCAGWFWKNAPTSLAGVLSGKEGTPCLRMEVVCDLDLWIWHFQFGLPGAYNDLNILDVSSHFNRVLAGAFPPVAPRYFISQEEFRHFYYQADGIYPRWRIFAQTLSDPQTPKEKNYSGNQECSRKCIERVFGVLFRRFMIMFVKSELWSVEKMRNIAKCCVILHNMIVEQRRGEYTSDGVCGSSSMYDIMSDNTDLTTVPLGVEGTSLRQQHMISASEGIKSAAEQKRLMQALMQHMWDIRVLSAGVDVSNDDKSL